MALIYRPCYCSREDVRRAVEYKQAAYANDRIDRACMSASEAVESLCQRKFYPEDKVCKFDWPNFQYAYPWRLWLENNELAVSPATLVTSGSSLVTPVTIPSANYILQPVNTGPPFTSLELKREKTTFFGNNPTPQLDIAITGTFGYWTKTRPAGTLTANIDNVVTAVPVSNSGSVSAGDVLVIGTERMLVTDSTYADTTVAYAGLSSDSTSDKVITVSNGSLFGVGEVLLVDSEWVLIEGIYGNNLVVRRAWDGSLLTPHTGGTLWARRSLTVLRGALGTVAASHSTNDALSVSEVPSLIRQLAVAEAEVWLLQESGGYAGSSASMAGAGSDPTPGPGVPDLRHRVENSKYARKARVRAI